MSKLKLFSIAFPVRLYYPYHVIRILLLICVLILSGCASTLPGGSICTERNGQCFDATIDGKNVIPLTSRDTISKYKNSTESARIQVDLESTEWTVAEPVSGTLNVHATINRNGASWFGSGAEVKVLILPLNGQKLASHAALAHDDSVRVSGNSIVKKKNILDQDSVPAGDYLLKIRVTGPSNWDSKVVLVKVK